MGFPFSFQRKLAQAVCLSLACLTAPTLAEAEEEVLLQPIEMVQSKNTINHITKSDFERKTALNIADALRGVNGVIVQKSGGRNEEHISIRGSNRYQVGMYVDDIPVTTAYRNEYDYSDVLTFDLESIEVSKGFSSTLLASNNNLAGAINLRTAKPKKEFEFTAKYLNFFDRRIHDQGRFAGISIGTKQEQYYLKASFVYNNQDFFTLPNSFNEAPQQGSGRRKNSDRCTFNGKIIAGWTPTEDNDIMVGFTRQHTKRGQPFDAAQTKIQNGKEAYPYNRSWYWSEYDTSRLYLNADLTPSLHSKLKFIAYYDWHQDTSESYEDYHMHVRDGADKKYDQYTLGAQAKFDYRFNNANKLAFSAGYRIVSHKEYDDYDVYHGEKQDYQKGEVLEQEIREGYWDLGAEYTLKPIDKLTLVFGASLSTLTPLTLEGRSKKGVMEDQSSGLDDTKTLFNYQVGAFYDIAQGHEIFASFAKKSRFATMRERYYRQNNAPANPDLDPEQAYHYELGYRGLISDWLKINTSVFYSDISDKIQSKGTKKTGMSFENLDHVRLFGYELGLEAIFNQYITAGATFSYLHWENCESDQRLTQLPAVSGNVYAKITPLPELTIIPQINYSSGFYWNSDGNDDDSYAKAPGFVTADLKATYKIGEHFSVEAGVKNLFDTEYAYDAYYPEPGRTFFAGVTVTF